VSPIRKTPSTAEPPGAPRLARPSDGPFVLAVVNGKGGVGKTTTSVNVAAVLAETYRVLLVDADPQASATWWIERGTTNLPFDLATEQDPELLARLRTLRTYDVVVVDTPPALASKALEAAVQSSDYVVLPTPPAPMDLTALIESVRSTVAPTSVLHRVLLTRVDPRSMREALEAQAALLHAGIPTFGAFIRSYKAHERAALEGIPITLWTGPHSAQANADYRRVANELLETAGLSHATSGSARRPTLVHSS